MTHTVSGCYHHHLTLSINIWWWMLQITRAYDNPRQIWMKMTTNCWSTKNKTKALPYRNECTHISISAMHTGLPSPWDRNNAFVNINIPLNEEDDSDLTKKTYGIGSWSRHSRRVLTLTAICSWDASSVSIIRQVGRGSHWETPKSTRGSVNQDLNETFSDTHHTITKRAATSPKESIR